MASSLRWARSESSLVEKTPRDAPFINVDLAVAAHVEHAQRPPDGLRPDQKLQVRLAAVLEELDDFLRWKRSVTRSLDDPAPPHTKQSPRKLKGARS